MVNLIPSRPYINNIGFKKYVVTLSICIESWKFQVCKYPQQKYDIFYVCVYRLRTSYTLNFCLFSSHSKVIFDCLLAQLSAAPPESLQEAYYSDASASYSKTVALASWNTLPEYYIMNTLAVVVLQLLSHILLFMTPRTAAHQASMSFTISQGLLKLMSIELVMPSNHLILCHPFLLLPSIFPSITVFSNESAIRIWWPKCCSFSFSISPSNEYSGLISFRIDWFDLLAVQRTLKSLLQYHSLKVSILRHSAFFIIQLSHPYMTAGKTIALTIWIFLAKWCLCFLIHCLGWS